MKNNRKRLMKLSWPFVILLVLGLVILKERIGLQLEDNEVFAVKEQQEGIYTVSQEHFTPQIGAKPECLIIASGTDEQSNIFLDEMSFILDSMKIGYDVCDVAEEELPDLKDYQKIVITASQLEDIGEDTIKLCEWVEQGGQLMNTGTFVDDGYFAILAAKAGIINIDTLYFTEVSGMHIKDGFMLNADDRSFYYDEPSLTALDLSLLEQCNVYIEDPVSEVPLLWEKTYGKGKFVMINQVLTGKVNRGMLSAAYSLLGPACVYPVINSSAFYIDDFPSPVPGGDGTYITKQYGMSIGNFYSNVWWPDMLALEEKYGILHTGLIIEEYSDEVKAPFAESNSQERFSFFGNMLLNNGGELGFHGYNHMPLCLEGYNYYGLYDGYEQWPSVEDMASSLTELNRFASKLFPKERFAVYVPPSNILSEEGRRILSKTLPNIRIIASTYFEGKAAYTQEFEVAEDGLIETPRITSGCNVDEYMMLSAFSELNFHYVQSHFLHPDDVLDEDRGAAMGWEKLHEKYEGYIRYIDDAAPDIRNMTGSGMGEAVRVYDYVTVEKQLTEKEIKLSLGGFYQEAYLMLRLNEGSPAGITGGELEHLTGNLYLVHATEAEVVIGLEKE